MDDADILAAWRLGPIRSTSTPATGAINRTVLVEAPGGRYALRAYRHHDRRRVEWEHAIIAHARLAGIPAPAPLPLPEGATIVEREGRFYALFPYAPGRLLDPAELGEREVAAMGRFLARLQQALASFPHTLVHRRSLAADRAATLAGMARVEAAAGRRERLTPDDRRILRRMAEQRAWVERAPLAGPDLGGVAGQVIHGDYQASNLFFEQGEVAAIIDWDQAYVAPPAWEVVRTLDLVFGFAPAPGAVFLRAYRAERPLPADELELAAACYSYLRAHDIWMYEAIFLQGNDRVRAFIPEGRFAPLAERWPATRAALGL